MRVVCLDSQVFVWGIKKQATVGQEDMIPLAQGFLRLLDKEQPLILVPSVVLFELLLPLPPKEHAHFVGRFWSDFMVVPFDVPAAQHAAAVWYTKKDDGTVQAVKEDLGASRTAIKADVQIIGTAIAHGATCIYSHDEPLKKLAEGFIDVFPMTMEPTLFDAELPTVTSVQDPEPPVSGITEDGSDIDEEEG